jgi:phosphate transport system substrate-binding protein
VTLRATLATAAATVIALVLAACGSSGTKSSATINGAGSTLAAPVYEQWGSTVKSQGVTLNYSPVGSGAGVAQFTAGTTNFAATDPPLKDSEIAALPKGKPVHVPTVLGAITVSYNLSGVPSGMKLDGKTIADMFLGNIKTWNDPALTKLNPGLKLPSTPITIVHRSDSSGTTAGFTTFLSNYSPTWKTQVGSNKDVKWPTGTGAKGNSGVAAAIKQAPGAVGYVEQAYALQNNFTFARVKNKSGNYVTPTLASTSAAAARIAIPPDLRFKAIDSPNPTAYPIASQTFIVVYQDLCKGGMSSAQAKAMVKFLNYGLGAGQSSAQQLSYAPLPSGLLAKAQSAVSSLSCNGASP